jgi:hypothetical protein
LNCAIHAVTRVPNHQDENYRDRAESAAPVIFIPNLISRLCRVAPLLRLYVMPRLKGDGPGRSATRQSYAAQLPLLRARLYPSIEERTYPYREKRQNGEHPGCQVPARRRRWRSQPRADSGRRRLSYSSSPSISLGRLTSSSTITTPPRLAFLRWRGSWAPRMRSRSSACPC